MRFGTISRIAHIHTHTHTLPHTKQIGAHTCNNISRYMRRTMIYEGTIAVRTRKEFSNTTVRTTTIETFNFRFSLVISCGLTRALNSAYTRRQHQQYAGTRAGSIICSYGLWISTADEQGQ